MILMLIQNQTGNRHPHKLTKKRRILNFISILPENVRKPGAL